jgi:hypothetical protein
VPRIRLHPLARSFITRIRGGGRRDVVASAAYEAQHASPRHPVVVLLDLRRLYELIALALGSEHAKELEIVVLGHQLDVPRRQVARPGFAVHDRAFLAAASRVLPRCAGGRSSSLPRRFFPDTASSSNVAGRSCGAPADRLAW